MNASEDTELIIWLQYVMDTYFPGFESSVRGDIIEEMLKEVSQGR